MQRAQADNKFWFTIDGLAVCAGLLYASWPLGPLLNPSVARRGLASGLEGTGQPFNWLFITGDILSSLAITLVCWLLWRRLQHAPERRILRTALISVVLFAVGTIVDALVPLKCEPSIQRCPSFTHDPLLLAHGLFSILAAIFLFIALFVLWWQHRRYILFNGLLYGYVLFGLFSVVSILKPALGNWSQHYYLTLCGFWLALLPHAVRKVTQSETALADIAAPKADKSHA